jgi:Tol biopolymer transport system component
MDYATRQERIVSTLSAETVDGFNIDGMAVSPDRTRIVVASLFGATQADVATGVGGNRLWSMDIYGGDMLRLTPVFTGGPDTTRVDVRNPTFSQDGQRVYYDYGEYSGGSWYVAPWWVPPDGSAKPQLFEIAVERCSINFVAAANPATGDLLVKHTVCIPGTHGGYFLYPRAGGAPVQLVDDALINLSTERPTFSPDGAGFLFTARDANGIQSLYAYLFDTQQISLVIEGTPDMDVVTGVFSPDFSHIVYCVKEKGGGSTDLWALDVSVNPPSNQRLTQDGQSCHPVF